MAQVERLLIFLASPGDVPNERHYVQEVIGELNRTVASTRGITLQVVSWENDAFPGYGMDAQALINKQIAEMARYSLFVGIMWNRLGTPTPRAESGTVEEFERAVATLAQYRQPNIWFYFRQAPAKLDTDEQLEQRKKVLAFKKQFQASGVPWSYKTPTAFRDKFRIQMILWLNSRTREAEMPPESKTAVAEPQARDSATKQQEKGVDAHPEFNETHAGRTVVPYPPTSLPQRLSLSCGIIFVLVDGGTGIVGNSAYPKDGAVRQVRLLPYYMSIDPITNRDFYQFMRESFKIRDSLKHILGNNFLRHWRSNRPSNGLMDHPVTYVSWEAARRFCNWLQSSNLLVLGNEYKNTRLL